ncbi:uncharacterized protein [Spinacia oleracea]|uniref:Retrotransposon gag domain-containing protein n=1 Tax=Spinacia oleracea TaxID=3562 RepID=A0ABM3RI90_SPIOL|nr:uncharacterized protein LOC130469849 [Spinacia oleracea]
MGAQFSPDHMRTALEVLTFLTQTTPQTQVIRPLSEAEVEQRRKLPRPQNNPRVWRRNLQQDMEGANYQECKAESTTPSRARPRTGAEQRPSPMHHSVSGIPNPIRAIVKPGNSPFCDEILSERMKKIKIPTCKFSGKTYPVNHLSAFRRHIMLYTNTDSMWCKVFPSTLEGIAQSWFDKIPKGAITSFRQLAILFRTQYVANIARERMTGELMSVVQGSQESLRDYISRFNMEASNIPKLQQEVAVLAMMSGLRDGEFKSYLGRKSFTTLVEVLGKENEFIKSEEIGKTTSRRKAYLDRRDNQQHKKEWGGPNRGRGSEFRAEKRGKYNEYTPLVASRTQNVAISKEDEKWQRPPKMYNKYMDPKKYCDFHSDHGHLTKECTHLKDNIEDLIRRGYLTQFKAKIS